MCFAGLDIHIRETERANYERPADRIFTHTHIHIRAGAYTIQTLCDIESHRMHILLQMMIWSHTYTIRRFASNVTPTNTTHRHIGNDDNGSRPLIILIQLSLFLRVSVSIISLSFSKSEKMSGEREGRNKNAREAKKKLWCVEI